MCKVKSKKDNHNKSMISYEIYHEENPYTRILKKSKTLKSHIKPIKKKK